MCVCKYKKRNRWWLSCQNNRPTTGKDHVEEGQLGGVLAPELEHGVLPSDESTHHEHDGYGGQADEQYERIGLLHEIEALLVAEHLHDSDGAVSHRRPEHAADEYGAGEERTRFAYQPIDDVQRLDKHAALRIDDDVRAVALRTSHLYWAVAFKKRIDVNYIIINNDSRMMTYDTMMTAMMKPCCFSSIHRCKHDLCTHLAVPRHLHGDVHEAV